MKKLIVLTLLLCVLAFAVQALTVTVSAPSSGGTANDTYNFTATISGFTAGKNVTVNECVFSTTADGIFGNSTMGNVTTFWNQSDTSALTEVEDTTLTVSCYNHTGDLVGTGTQTINIDNTNPVCDCSLASDNVEAMDEINYDCLDSTDTTDLSYSCVATYDSGDTETETDGQGYFSETDDKGDFSIACTVTDEASKTNSCTALTGFIKSKSGVPPDPEEENNMMAILAILLIVVVAVVVIAVSMSGKKKKRR